MPEVLVAILAALSASLGVGFTGEVLERAIRQLLGHPPAEGETFERRIDRLTRTLRESAQVVSEMESEIERRQGLVERLRREQQLLELSRDEVEAVAQALRGELRREGRKAFWLNVAQGAVFFLLGLGAALLIQ